MTESTDFDREVGARIQTLRESKGMLQSELALGMKARGLNWSQTILSKVERGERPLRLQEAGALVKQLGLVSADELIGAGPYFEEKFALASRVADEREAELFDAALSYIQSLGYKSLAGMCESLFRDANASWRTNCTAYELRGRLAEALAETVSTNAGEPERLNRLILSELGVPSDDLQRLEDRVNELVSAVETGVDVEQVWGPQFERVAIRQNDEDDFEFFIRWDANNVAFAESFARNFPNVQLSAAVDLIRGSLPFAARALLSSSDYGAAFVARVRFATAESGTDFESR